MTWSSSHLDAILVAKDDSPKTNISFPWKGVGCSVGKVGLANPWDTGLVDATIGTNRNILRNGKARNASAQLSRPTNLHRTSEGSISRSRTYPTHRPLDRYKNKANLSREAPRNAWIQNPHAGRCLLLGTSRTFATFYRPNINDWLEAIQGGSHRPLPISPNKRWLHYSLETKGVTYWSPVNQTHEIYAPSRRRAKVGDLCWNSGPASPCLIIETATPRSHDEVDNVSSLHPAVKTCNAESEDPKPNEKGSGLSTIFYRSPVVDRPDCWANVNFVWSLNSQHRE